MKIKYKLIFLFSIIALAPLLIIGRLSYFYAKNELEKERIIGLQSYLDAETAHVTDVMQLQQRHAKIIANTYLARQLNPEGKNSPDIIKLNQQNISSILSSLNVKNDSSDSLNTGTSIKNISMMDVNGVIIASTNKDNINSRVSNEILERVKNNQINYPFYQNSVNGKEAEFIVLHGIFTAKEKKFLGAIQLQIKPRILDEITIDKKELGKTADIYIVSNDNGRIQFLTELRFTKSPPIIKMGDSLGIPSQKAVSGVKGYGIVNDYRGDVPTLAVWKPIPGLNMGIVAKIDADEAFAPIYDLRKKMMLAGLIIVVLSVILAFYFSKLFSEPIAKILDAFAKISKGELTDTILISGKDEFGQLSKTANQSIEYLKDKIKSAAIVGSGDYSNDISIKSNEDALGISLQKMTESLRDFDLNNKNLLWLQEGKNLLSEKLRGDNTKVKMAEDILEFLESYLSTQISAFYSHENGVLKLTAANGITENTKTSFTEGEGIIGQAAKEMKLKVLTKLPEDYFKITSALGDGQPDTLVLLPAVSEDKTIAVIEMAKFGNFTPIEIRLLEELAEPIAIVFRSIDNKNKLEELSLRLNQQVNALNDSAIVSETDADGNITAVNDMLCGISGYSREELIGKNHRILKSGLQPDSLFVGIWKAISLGKLWKGEIINKKKDGGHYWVDSTIVPFKNTDGKIYKYVGIQFEITKQKEQLNEIDAFTKAINKANAVIEFDLEGKILFANKNYLEMMHYGENEIIGKHHSIFVDEDYKNSPEYKKFWKNLREGIIQEGQFERFDKNGNKVFIQANYNPVYSIEGKPYKISKLAIDLTLIKKLNDELTTQAEELRNQQEQLQEINAELEAQTQKLQASDEELRAQQEELIQGNQELEEKSQLLEEKNQAISEKNEELEAASTELKEKAEQLAQSGKYKSEFLANMSHELRTPLNSILLLSKLLSDNHEHNLSKEQIDFASIIHKSGNGLLELIDEILDLSKIESGKMDLELGKVKLNELCDNMNDIFNPMAKEKGIIYDCIIESEAIRTIYTDRIRIEQILKNLLSNAIKFTETGGVKIRVYVPDTNLKDKLEVSIDNPIAFSVSDTGIGINLDKQELVFEAFQQADGSTRRKYGGTGLGLSISREIAHLLGGEILLESEIGKGSVFTLILPTNCVDTKTEKRSVAKEKKLTYAAPEKDLISILPDEIPDDRNTILEKDRVILLVEDDPNIAKVLMKFSHDRGYKVVLTVHRENAAPFAEKYRPMGILIDNHLAFKNGWTIMNKLKENPRTQHIPVHIMSASDVKSKDDAYSGSTGTFKKSTSSVNLQKVFDKMETILDTKTKTILLVDDNKFHTNALQAFLNGVNKKCMSASNAVEAYTLLENNKIDCIVLDLDLPDETGFEVLEKIKSQTLYEKLPVIIYTGKSLSVKEEQRLKQYANAIIIKTADSYKRLLNEVTLFLNVVDEKKDEKKAKKLYLKDKALAEKKILLVDDDSRNIFSLTKVLELHEMEVIAAVDGKDALELLKENQNVDAVLMDMMMPEMDGYEAIREIRKMQKFKEIPIIALTAKAMVGDREKCIKAGADDYITKPVDTDQLISLLRIWLYK